MARRKTKRGPFRSGRQLLYVMRDRGTNDLKIGISNRPDLRAAQVTEENRKGGRTQVVAHWWFVDAHRVEQFLHRLFSWMNRPRSGDGGTEWFDPDAALWMLICVAVGVAANYFTSGNVRANDAGAYLWTCVIGSVVLRALLFRLVLCALIWILWAAEKGVIIAVFVVVLFLVALSL